MKFLPDQNYDCVLCGRSCQGWNIEVDLATRGRIRGSELELRVLQETGLSSTLVPGDHRTRMASRGDACVYLDENKLCRIHGEMGAGAKPHGCRQFPFLMVETPDDTYVGLSFYCTAAQRNEGRPLAEHQDDVEALLRKLPARKVGFRPLVLEGDGQLDWAEYKELEQFLWEGLAVGFPERALSIALWAACTKEGPWRFDPDISEVFDRATELFDTRLLCLSSLVAAQEAASPDQTWPLTEAIRADEPVHLTRTGWTGRRSEIDARAPNLPPWVHDEIQRYLRALVFRKFLALDRTVLQNLIVLYMMPPILRSYTILFSMVRGGEVEREDYYRALSFTEKDLSHTLQGAEGTWSTFARLYQETIKLIKPYV